MRVFIGLGNPGDIYAGTRHNVGFAVVDEVASRLGIRITSGRGEYLIGKGSIGGHAVGVVKPLTYMNNSGTAVLDVLGLFGCAPEQLLVVADDFHLPLGKLRLRLKGSAGGHNGLYSIIYHLQTDQFPRLRCGIAGNSMPESKKEMSGYVLSRFENGERTAADHLIGDAGDALIVIATQGIEAAMNIINRQRL